MLRSVKVVLAAPVVVISIVALIFLIKYATVFWLDREVNKAWAPLNAILETRYNNVERLAQGINAFKGEEDGQAKALLDAAKEFTTAGKIPQKIEASKRMEALLRNFFMHQNESLPGLETNYDFVIARRGFQVTRQLMKEPLKKYDDEVVRFNAYCAGPINGAIAKKLGIKHEGLYFNEDGTIK